MSFESITNERIKELLDCPKNINNPTAKSRLKDGHEQINYSLTSESGDEFEVYKRQNKNEGMEDDFSCGIKWISGNGESLTLKRYNGASHDHFNRLENEKLGYACHVHVATENYIKSNKKADGFAERTDKYQTIEEAFHCLVTDCNISGIKTNPVNNNQTNLFKL